MSAQQGAIVGRRGLDTFLDDDVTPWAKRAASRTARHTAADEIAWQLDAMLPDFVDAAILAEREEFEREQAEFDAECAANDLWHDDADEAISAPILTVLPAQLYGDAFDPEELQHGYTVTGGRGVTQRNDLAARWLDANDESIPRGIAA